MVLRNQAHELSRSFNSNSLSLVPLAFVYLALGSSPTNQLCPLLFYTEVLEPLINKRHLSSKFQFCMEPADPLKAGCSAGSTGILISLIL